jgi:S-adenosylmethionine decarboxylase
MRQATTETGLTTLHSYFYGFSRGGVTGMILLKESHISIHTWPEHNYAAVDVFTCGSRKDAFQVYRSLVESLQPQHVNKEEIRHGIGR